MALQRTNDALYFEIEESVLTDKEIIRFWKHGRLIQWKLTVSQPLENMLGVIPKLKPAPSERYIQYILFLYFTKNYSSDNEEGMEEDEFYHLLIPEMKDYMQAGPPDEALVDEYPDKVVPLNTYLDFIELGQINNQKHFTPEVGDMDALIAENEETKFLGLIDYLCLTNAEYEFSADELKDTVSTVLQHIILTRGVHELWHAVDYIDFPYIMGFVPHEWAFVALLQDVRADVERIALQLTKEVIADADEAEDVTFYGKIIFDRFSENDLKEKIPDDSPLYRRYRRSRRYVS